MIRASAPPRSLHLMAGELVEVRSWEEIAETLDEEGRLEGLPFMPEMLAWCGRRVRVFKRADKTCNYIRGWSIRRMKDAVHLEAVRCDGSGHDGCEASCLIFWKEAWLRRAGPESVPVETLAPPRVCERLYNIRPVEDLSTASRREEHGVTIYSCQCTDVPRFTSHMSGWDLRQYLRDVTSGNLSSGLASGSRAQRWLDMALAALQVLRSLMITTFNKVQSARHGSTYPFLAGSSNKTPAARLDLKFGELVQVRSKEEIMATLDNSLRNRGLWFDTEMLPYCGGIYRVLRRVHHIIEESSGEMIHMKHACIILEGVVCRSDFHRLCPRAIYPYWREEWLVRASAEQVSSSDTQCAKDTPAPAGR